MKSTCPNLGDTVCSQLLIAHEITDRDTVSYLRQRQHLCPEDAEGWKLSWAIWRVGEEGAAHADRMAVGWQFFVAVLCSSVGTDRHKSLPSHTMSSHADADLEGSRQTGSCIYMSQYQYMGGKYIYISVIICPYIDSGLLLAYHFWWMSPAVVV